MRTAPRLVPIMLATIAAFALGACTSTNAEAVPGSFYLEAQVTVLDGASQEEVHSTLRWWSESVDRWRWEFEGEQAGREGSSESFSLSDGQTVWFYDGRTNTFQRSAPFELPEGYTATPLPISLLIGPAQVDSVDALVAAFQDLGDDATASVTGQTTMLGTDVVSVEYSPTWRSVSASADASSSGTATPLETTDSGGVGRMLVDPKRMFVLQHEIDGGDNAQYALIRVTKIQYDVPIDEALLRFEPPPGAIEETPSAGASGAAAATAVDGG